MLTDRRDERSALCAAKELSLKGFYEAVFVKPGILGQPPARRLSSSGVEIAERRLIASGFTSNVSRQRRLNHLLLSVTGSRSVHVPETRDYCVRSPTLSSASASKPSWARDPFSIARFTTAIHQ